VLDLSKFKNISSNVYVYEKWNWDYLEAESFQLKCVDFIQKNPHISIFIFCSHPHCFTVGRGLQKLKNSPIALVDFDRNTCTPFPVYEIKRGGGLTFHYPGQIVFYPIISTTFHKIAVNDLMIKILELTKKCLHSSLNLSDTFVRKDLLGLWFQNSFGEAKIASIGLAASRFVTYHGLALNLFNDTEMFECLRSLHPCGLPGDLYRDVETLTTSSLSKTKRDDFIEEFSHYLLSELIQSFQIDRHISL
jgi:lipoyl(octanoyl) transferase